MPAQVGYKRPFDAASERARYEDKNAVADIVRQINILSRIYRTGAFYSSTTLPSAVIYAHIFVETVDFPVNFVGSYGKALVAATAQTTFTIKKIRAGKTTAETIGSMIFDAGEDDARFSLSNAERFFEGDIITVTAPVTPDLTLADITFILAAVRI